MATMMGAPVTVTSTPSGGSRLAQMQVSASRFISQYKAVTSFFVLLICGNNCEDFRVPRKHRYNKNQGISITILTHWISYLTWHDSVMCSSRLDEKMEQPP
jgi:hypothetical protein